MDIQEQALQYIDAGCTVVPADGKRPIKGIYDGSARNLSQLTERWPAYGDPNVGIVVTWTRDGMENTGVAVIDVDPRHGGEATMQSLVSRYGEFTDGAPSALSGRGDGGRHYYYRADPERKLKCKLGAGVEIPLQAIAPPSIHPDTGKPYRWVNGGLGRVCDLPPLPEWAYDTEQEETTNTRTGEHTTGPLTAEEMQRIQAALARLDPNMDEYHWVRVCWALHNRHPVELEKTFIDWSSEATRVDSRGKSIFSISECRKKWARARGTLEGGKLEIAIGTLYKYVKRPDLCRETSGHIEVVQASPPPEKKDSIEQFPTEELIPYGPLGEFVKWADAIAPFKQPGLSVTGAIALGSVLMGRRYRTEGNPTSYSSLYVLNVADSTAGKNNALTAVKDVLRAAGLQRLVAGSSYTSNGGIVTAFRIAPTHIAVTDEFGDLLALSNGKGRDNDREAISLLKVAFTSLHSTIESRVYSKMDKTDEELESSCASYSIVHPAASILAATVSETFYGSINKSHVKGGLINRFIVNQSTIPKVPIRFKDKIRGNSVRPEPPDAVVEYAKAVHGICEKGNLYKEKYSEAPEAAMFRYTDSALTLFDQFDEEILDKMHDLEKAGMKEALGRTFEKSIRTSMIYASSRDHDDMCINETDARKAIGLNRHCDYNLIRSLQTETGATQYSRQRKTFLDIVTSAGPDGIPDWKIQRDPRATEYEPETRKKIINDLCDSGLIEKVRVKKSNGPGRPSMVWVAR